MQIPSWLADRQFLRIIILITALLASQFFIGMLVINNVNVNQAEALTEELSQRAKDDIIYSAGQWDMSRYDTDPEIPGSARLYVLTKDGFVIDRWRPVSGYLDTSDFKQLRQYTTAKTIRTVTGQIWRLLSLPIYNEAKTTIGLITVGSFNASFERAGDMDTSLASAASKLTQKLKVSGETINAESVNVRDIPYNISFQVVDQFNQIHVKSDNSSTIDRLPNYIDPSYIVDNLKTPSIKQITDRKHAETFLVRSTPINDSSNNPVGVIIVARTITPGIALVGAYVLWVVVASLVLIIIASVYLYKWTRLGSTAIAAKTRLLQAEDIANIEIDKNSHQIKINDHVVKFAYATNQYYLCLALFNSPKRKWESDELLDKLGEAINRDSWRKLYDAMNGINKKAEAIIGFKLILTSNKTYYLNPIIVNQVIKR